MLRQAGGESLALSSNKLGNLPRPRAIDVISIHLISLHFDRSEEAFIGVKLY